MKIITKYTEFRYGIRKNVYKTYTKRIISVYKFLIGLLNTFLLTSPLISTLRSRNNHSFKVRNGVSAGKRDQIEIFFEKKFLSKMDVDLTIWFRTCITSKKIFLSIPNVIDLSIIIFYFIFYLLIQLYF